jgi:type IV pilus assembly protein PilW
LGVGNLTVKAPRGTSLLELLVAQALGLMLMSGVLQSLSDALAQQGELEDQSELRESAQIVALVLQQQLASAGFVDWMNGDWSPSVGSGSALAAKTLPGGAALFACPGDMQGSAWQHASASPSDRPRCGAVRAVRHTLQVVRQGASQTQNTQASKDCLQQNSSGPWVVNRLYTSVGNLGSQLLCAGSGNQTGQALVAGVEEWVFRFLVRHADGQTQWLATADMGPAEADHWQRVVRVEVCWIQVSQRTGRGGLTSLAGQSIRPTCLRGTDGEWLTGVTRAAGDRRWWQRHTHTVALLNHLEVNP